MIKLKGIVPVKIIDNTFYAFTSDGKKMNEMIKRIYELDFNQNFVLLEWGNVINKMPKNIDFKEYESIILNKKFAGRVFDEEDLKWTYVK